MAPIPPGRKLCFFNPLDQSILPLEVPLAPEMGLAAARSGALTVRKKAADGGVYVVDPGLLTARLRGRWQGGRAHGAQHRPAHVGLGKAKLYLDTIGEGDAARFARTGGGQSPPARRRRRSRLGFAARAWRGRGESPTGFGWTSCPVCS